MKFSKKINLTNQLLKIFSMIFGYFVWVIFAQNQNIDISLQVPISYYGLKNNFEIESPETIKIKLNGKRLNLYALDTSRLAFHVDASSFQNPGEQVVKLTPSHILLHNKIKLIEYLPSSLTIKIKEIKNEQSDKR